MAGVAGGGLGVVMSFVGWGFASGGSMGGALNTPAYYDMSTKDQLKASWKELATTSKRNMRDFAKIGAVYSLTECIIEKQRGRADIKNAVSAGCITGAYLGRASPQGAALGCASFAAFSGAIEWYLS
jgi:import inner membrane translocase subunit TIM22